MKCYDGGVTLFILIAVVCLVGFLSTRFLDDDNLIEETSEEVIKIHTGVDIDLSPSSKEFPS
jgi:Na+-transporting methylmalonyl-CoA/oxaloacetate decarboxylase gamma subunit